MGTFNFNIKSKISSIMSAISLASVLSVSLFIASAVEGAQDQTQAKNICEIQSEQAFFQCRPQGTVHDLAGFDITGDVIASCVDSVIRELHEYEEINSQCDIQFRFPGGWLSEPREALRLVRKK